MSPEMENAVDFLYDLPRFTKKNSLEHTRRLTELLGNPCADRKIVHVAGTNGKGSVCNFTEHMLLAGGADTAMFTSPHLTDIRERFRICGEPVSEEVFLSAYDRVTGAARTLEKSGEPHPTFFEFLYAMALVMFEDTQAEFIILETGLGGRLDATNSFPDPVLTVITPVGLDHTEILGDTIEQIAAEKAGILRPGVPLVYAADDERAAAVIAERALELGCPAWAVSKTSVNIDKTGGNFIDFSLVSDHGETTVWRVPGCAVYQAENAALAIESMRVLRGILSDKKYGDRAEGTACRMDDETLKRGLLASEWPGRMQEVLPDIYFDGAHNPAAVAAFLESAQVLAADDADRPMLLFAMAKDKDFAEAAEMIVRGVDWDAVAVTKVPGERGADAEIIAGCFAKAADADAQERSVLTPEVFDDCRDAFRIMRERKRDGQKLFCTGSLYFIGDLMKIMENSRGQEAVDYGG